MRLQRNKNLHRIFAAIYNNSQVWGLHRLFTGIQNIMDQVRCGDSGRWIQASGVYRVSSTTHNSQGYTEKLCPPKNQKLQLCLSGKQFDNFSRKLNINLPILFPRLIKTYIHTKISTEIFTATLEIATKK